jgi:DNA-binding transcriptional LysR family regulator
MPHSPADLTHATAVVFSGLAPNDEWLFGGAKPVRVPVKPRLRTNQVDAAIDACLAGLGFGQFLCYQVEALIAAGQLVRVLTDHEPPPLPVSIVYPGTRLVSANLRALLDGFEKR